MKSNGHTAIRAIIIMGVMTFVFLLVAAAGLKKTVKLVESRRADKDAPTSKQSPFDGARAYADLKTVVGYGPRVAGSQESADLRAFLRRELEAAGLEVSEQAFEASTPLGVRPMVNLVASIQGTRPGIILIGSHYDTKYFPEFRFVGANDGGSTTAWLLEMARAIGPLREGRRICLVFFDGEEAFKEWSSTDSLYGSRAFVQDLQDQGQAREVAAMINVDMIGDCQLDIKKDADAPAWLTDSVWRTAERLGYSAYFLPARQQVQDDHLPFRQAGIPALELIDFDYGGSAREHEKNWHTPNDTLDKVCPNSLQAVGDVVYHALTELDACLDKNGRH